MKTSRHRIENGMKFRAQMAKVRDRTAPALKASMVLLDVEWDDDGRRRQLARAPRVVGSEVRDGGSDRRELDQVGLAGVGLLLDGHADDADRMVGGSARPLALQIALQ